MKLNYVISQKFINWLCSYSLCICMAIGTFDAAAQHKFHDYIVTSKNDTILGRVRLLRHFSKNIIFISKGSTKRYNPSDIKGFHTHAQAFESVVSNLYTGTFSTDDSQVNGKPGFKTDTSFAICMVKGKLNVYWLQDEQRGDQYIVQKADSVYADLYHYKYTNVLADSINTAENMKGYYIFQRYNYIKLLKRLTSDCPSVQSQLNEKVLSNKNITQLASDYDECVEPTISHYKWKPLVAKVDFGISAGVSVTAWSTNITLYYLNEASFNVNQTPFVAITMDIIPASIRQHLDWQNWVGLLHYRTAGESNSQYFHSTYDFNISNVTLMSSLTYRFGSGVIKPYVGLGVTGGYPLVRNVVVEQTNTLTKEKVKRDFYSDNRPFEEGTNVIIGIQLSDFNLQFNLAESSSNTFMPQLSNYGSNRRSKIFTLGYQL